MFYPPEGLCGAEPERGPIVFSLHFIGVGRGTQDSKSYWVYRIFFFAKKFYPPKGVCFADSQRGPIVFTLHFIGVGRGTGGFNFRGGNPPF